MIEKVVAVRFPFIYIYISTGRLYCVHASRMKLFIKYMVSLRCKMIVKDQLAELGIDYVSVDLGVVQAQKALSSQQRAELNDRLSRFGLELLDDKRSILIEKIKNVIVEMVHYTEEFPAVTYSEYISGKLNYDYTYLSNVFSEVNGITIQEFIIRHKIERVKELLLYDELTLTEIATKLRYSSIGHLSNQFKKVTGLSPSFFKKMRKKRNNLEDI
jgi:AraC-like DNA-binding protein